MAEEQIRTGDSFTDAILEDSRTRRQTGTETPARDIDYLNTPPLRRRMEGARESTNVEDRRGEPFLDRGGIEDAIRGGAQQFVGISPYASPERVKKAWDTAIEVGKGFMEDVNQTLQALINPTAEVTAEPGTEERFAQEMLAQRAQGRAAARVGMDLATAGMSRAVGASEAAVGAFGGRLPNRAKVREGMEARVVYDDAAKAEFRIGTPEGKKVGEYTVMEGSVPNTLSIENIVVNKEFQRQGVARDVYAQLRAQAGDKEVIPSGSLQEGTYRLWKEMNPKLLEAGKYKKLKDGSYERTDDNFTSYFQRMSAVAGGTTVAASTAKADDNRPWSSLEELRSNMKGPDREWVGNPVQLENGGLLSYPMAPTWKGVEQETGMTKGQLKEYFQRQIDLKAVSERERKYLKRDLDELFSRKDTGSGLGEGWYDLQELIRPRPEGSPSENEVPPPSTGNGGVGEGKAFYGM